MDSSNLAMWSGLVGAFLPMVVAFVMQPTIPTWARSVLSVIICVIAAAVTVWLQGDFDFDRNLVGSILIVLVTAQATYQSFWKPTKVAPVIELKTSPDSEEKTKALTALKRAA